MLTPYEAMVALDAAPAFWKESDEEGNYPMDYYAKDGGEWSSSYHKTQKLKQNKTSIQCCKKT